MSVTDLLNACHKKYQRFFLERGAVVNQKVYFCPPKHSFFDGALGTKLCTISDRIVLRSRWLHL